MTKLAHVVTALFVFAMTMSDAVAHMNTVPRPFSVLCHITDTDTGDLVNYDSESLYELWKRLKEQQKQTIPEAPPDAANGMEFVIDPWRMCSWHGLQEEIRAAMAGYGCWQQNEYTSTAMEWCFQYEKCLCESDPHIFVPMPFGNMEEIRECIIRNLV